MSLLFSCSHLTFTVYVGATLTNNTNDVAPISNAFDPQPREDSHSNTFGGNDVKGEGEGQGSVSSVDDSLRFLNDTGIVQMKFVSKEEDGLFYNVYAKAMGFSDRLETLFSADGKSQMDYIAFGDVLVFDMIYRTNAYKKPFVILAGVSNNFMTTIFGCALLSKEIKETYSWVLATFLKAMDGKRPNSVVTDGDLAMRNAIRNIFPDARHRLCLWHLERNVAKNVHRLEFVSDFTKLMQMECEVEEFESLWADMVSHYGLQINAWVVEMYRDHERWAEAYFLGHFFAGMRTTQRCKGMSCYMNQFLKRIAIMSTKKKILDSVSSPCLRRSKRLVALSMDQSTDGQDDDEMSVRSCGDYEEMTNSFSHAGNESDGQTESDGESESEGAIKLPNLSNFVSRLVIEERSVAIGKLKKITHILDLLKDLGLNPLCTYRGKANWTLVREFFAGIDPFHMDKEKRIMVSKVRGHTIKVTPDRLAQYKHIQ
ncbi:hypothetical protein RHMOL_Rhmol01G0184700 [Rhododendron molle]|uniref:Uncharacterized protein n=1 Tax=Rhododendron molle TaxID=49168 RepID=A0ACC0Q4F9_RHOML|nr:hypothetical protein RHMOL_Rhmol01G0184700 [Rhododendron molle]